MPYTRPSLQTIIDRIISDLNNRVDNSQTFLRRSVFKILANVLGGALHLVYEYINFVKDQLFITYADVEHLERHGTEYGIYRNAGVKATGTTVVNGTAGITITAGTELEDSSGLKYKTTADSTITAGGTANLTLIASEVGEDYDQDASTVLSFITALAGVNLDTTVDSDGITGGEDEETDEEYRARVLLRKRYPPHGGIANDYENWALEYAGVTRAWAIPEYQGIGTIGLIFVFDDNDPIFPNETTRDLVRDYIIEHSDPVLGKDVGIPVTAEPGFFTPGATALTVDFDIQLSPNNSTVQAAVDANLADLILTRGGPGQT